MMVMPRCKEIYESNTEQEIFGSMRIHIRLKKTADAEPIGDIAQKHKVKQCQ